MDNLIPFQPLLRNLPVEIYTSGHLPHWRQNGCTYFVTFRTADSIPAHIAKRLEEEKSHWLKKLGKPLEQLTESEKRTLSRTLSFNVERELDQHHGKCPFGSKETASRVAESLHFFDKRRFRLGNFVIMPNHVHVLLTPLPDFSLESILHSIKRYTARTINQQLKISGAFWQRDSYDHIVRDAEQLHRFQNYISTNPVKAGISPDKVISHRACYETS